MTIGGEMPKRAYLSPYFGFNVQLCDVLSVRRSGARVQSQGRAISSSSRAEKAGQEANSSGDPAKRAR